MDDVALNSWRLTETEKIAAWRLLALIDGGWPVVLAEKVAARSDVDLHRAVELVRDGCSPTLAAEILL